MISPKYFTLVTLIMYWQSPELEKTLRVLHESIKISSTGTKMFVYHYLLYLLIYVSVRFF